MEKRIRLLDCTLRDGGHIVQGRFGENTIKNTIERLVKAKVDIIEAGFLWQESTDNDTARYHTIADIRKVLPTDCGQSKISLMADYIDLKHLEPCDGTVDIIRLSFKRWRLDWGLEAAQILMDKGYKVFINPVNNNVYSDKEYIEILEKVNELHPYGFSIVDTFGVMRVSDLLHRYYLVENNLAKDITIGFHFHENMGLAYSLAQNIIKNVSSTRNIVIDGSLLGMGRVPGNLCTEQIIDYMNDQLGTDYNIEHVYDAIDDYIAPIKATNPWGYAIPYALSAKYYLHRTYAEFLAGKKRLKTKDIQRILSQVAQSKAETYDEDYIDGLYKSYMDVKYDDSFDMEGLKEILSQFDNVLIVAPGRNLSLQIDRVKKIIDSNPAVISVNFNPSFEGIESQFVFLTNTKRYDDIKDKNNDEKLIITSNLIRDISKYEYCISYNNLVYFDDEYCDDSTLMLISLLSKLGIRRIMLAGFDGKIDGKFNFFDSSFDRNSMKSTNGTRIGDILNTYFKDIEKIFITDSEYMQIYE